MLTRWKSFHPDWQEEVGSVAIDTDDGLVFIDPLEPPAELGPPAHVLVTIFWHDRSAGAVGARHVWSSRRAVRMLGNRGIAVTDTIEDGGLPGGIQAFPTARAGEVVYWVPSEGAVVVGDVLLGAGAKPKATDDPLRLCPERWLGAKKTHDDLRASLRPLLELPVQQVLPSHGQPVLRNAKAVLAGLLVIVALVLAGCGGGGSKPKAATCPATDRALAKLDRDIETMRTAKAGHATDVATDHFLLDVAIAPISNLQRNRLIDHAAAAVSAKCPQCFMALESARPIPSIRAGDSKCPTS